MRPFAFDWREDIAKSAARLDEEVRGFGAGEPVHLVAHSMGGLVARYVSRHFAATWTSMDDGNGPRQRADASSCWARRTAARSRRCWR